ncbi:MAG: hypothetical protein ACTHZ5_11950 [Micrococcaceae bacterium]
MSAADAQAQSTKRARTVVLMGLFTAAGTAIPLGRLPLGRTAAVSAGVGAGLMGASLLLARRENEPTETEGQPAEPTVGPARTAKAAAVGMVLGGAVVSVGMTTSVLADRWIEKGVRALGSRRPRAWMIAGAGVLGAALEWADQRTPSSDSHEAAATA